MTRVHGRSPLAPKPKVRTSWFPRLLVASPRWWDRMGFWAVLLFSTAGIALGSVSALELRAPTVEGTVTTCSFHRGSGKSPSETVCHATWTLDGVRGEDDVEVPEWIETGGSVTLQVLSSTEARERHQARTLALLLPAGLLGWFALVVLGCPPRRS